MTRAMPDLLGSVLRVDILVVHHSPSTLKELDALVSQQFVDCFDSVCNADMWMCLTNSGLSHTLHT